MTTYPRIHLAIDNCFASKRWTRPLEWMSMITDLGLCCIEASADTECDPLYMGPAYLADWIKDIKKAEERTGARVVNLYSGHGTYSTLGLGHTDNRVSDRILYEWLKPMKENAGRLGAGLGFFCHAFPDATLQDPEAYRRACGELIERLAKVATLPAEGCTTVGVEQMYSPHQIPWTISGAKELLAATYERAQSPFYITIDTGHQSGQRRFLKPAPEQITAALGQRRAGLDTRGLWLGPQKAYLQFQDALTQSSRHDDEAAHGILQSTACYPYLFADPADGDPYRWISELGTWSPIIHLQQTDGTSSSHRPFTKEHNQRGIISPDKVIQALKKAWDRPVDPVLPPRVTDVYLTLELFSATADISADILSRLAETVTYWRNVIPTDGQRLDLLETATAEMN